MTTIASQLEEVQGFLQGLFRRPDPIPDEPALAQRVAEHLTGNDRLSPAEQADIYRRQYFLRHVEALTEDHAGLVHYLGEDGFEALARAYLARHPPRSYTLRDLGEHMATFVAGWDGTPPELRALLTDIARYELCIVEIFDAADVPPPDAARLASLPREAWLTRPLVFTPHLRLFRFDYPVPDLRRALKNGELSKDPPPAEPARYGVFRRDDMVAFERLTPEAHDLLALLLAKKPLVTACEELSQMLTEAAAAKVEAEVGSWFQRWASWGWILSVEDE